MRLAVFRKRRSKFVATETSMGLSWEALPHRAIEMPTQSNRDLRKERGFPTNWPSQRHRYHVTIYFACRTLHQVWPQKTTNLPAGSSPDTAVPALESHLKD